MLFFLHLKGSEVNNYLYMNHIIVPKLNKLLIIKFANIFFLLFYLYFVTHLTN